jgi:hypothetical protein
VGDVKALILPAGESVDLRIEAYAAGTFGLHVFTPESPSPIRFEPVSIQPGDRFMFSLPGMVLATPALQSASIPVVPPDCAAILRRPRRDPFREVRE